LQVNPNGSKLWRYQYQYSGKAKLMALGKYPDVSLSKARERHQKAREVLADGIDQMAQRKAAGEAPDATVVTFHGGVQVVACMVGGREGTQTRCTG
jgi:hypothetical protein